MANREKRLMESNVLFAKKAIAKKKHLFEIIQRKVVCQKSSKKLSRWPSMEVAFVIRLGYWI